MIFLKDKNMAVYDFKGDYNNTTAYIINDTVKFNGLFYACILGITGTPPTGLQTDNANWAFVETPEIKVEDIPEKTTNVVAGDKILIAIDSEDGNKTKTMDAIEFKGDKGETGNTGSDGLDGNTVLNGTVNPTSEGVDGDFYLNTITTELFGPKALGVWPLSGVILEGTDGLDGNTVLNGAVNPTTQGVDGDFYINTVTNTIFGPKTTGFWGAGTSLIGPKGDNGEDGRSFIWLGEYFAGATYLVDYTVGYQGSSYICIQESTGNLPTNTSYWSLMAQKGDDAIGDMVSTNNLSDVEDIEESRDNLGVNKKIDVVNTSVSINPALVDTHYLVDASSGNIIITLPNVTSGDEGIFQITLTENTHKVTITTVGGTQLIGDSISQFIQTVGGSLFLSANGVDGYNITGDSRSYYRTIDFIGAGISDLSISGFGSGAIYHCEPGDGNTRTIIIPDADIDCDGNFAKFLLSSEGTVIIKTISDNLIAGLPEITLALNQDCVELVCLGDHYDIVQDSRAKITNTSLTSYSLTEDSAVVDPAGGFYRQASNSIDDPRYDKITGTIVQTPIITGPNIYGGGVISDEGVPQGLIPEGPIVTSAFIKKDSGSSDFNFYIEYYLYETDTTETLLTTSNVSQTVSSSVYAEYQITALMPQTDFGTDGRLLRKIYVNKVGTAVDPVGSFHVEGPNPSYSIISVTAGNISHNILAGIENANVGVKYGHIDNKYPLVFPNLTTTERDAIVSPIVSMKIFNTTTAQYEKYDGADWVEDGGGDGGGIVMDTFSASRSSVGASGTITYNHSLGKIPTGITMSTAFLSADIKSCEGSFVNGGSEKVLTMSTEITTTLDNLSCYINYNGGGQTGHITNVTDTTFDIVWARFGSPPTTTYKIVFTLFG